MNSCTGNCQQGKYACDTPQACEVADTPIATPEGMWLALEIVCGVIVFGAIAFGAVAVFG